MSVCGDWSPESRKTNAPLNESEKPVFPGFRIKKSTVNGPIEVCRSRRGYQKSEMVAGRKEDVAVLANQRPAID
jgi:hypothetical protein